jgi:hypothetical protein
MSRFIKLTKLVINTNDIHQIYIHPNKYYIYLKSIDGFCWSFAGSGMGSFSSHNSKIEVCETKDYADYKIVSDWISKIK